MHRDVVQLCLAIVTVIVAIGGLVFGLHGQIRADLQQVRDGDRATRLEVRMEAVGPGPGR